MFKLFVLFLLLINPLQIPPALGEGKPSTLNSPIPAEPIRLWLEEVRAQREFLNARRRAAKKSADAHLRAVDPWVADRVEAAAQETKLRRELSNQRHKSLEDEHRARMESLERESHNRVFLLPPYYIPYPCPYFNNNQKTTKDIHCQ